MKQKLIILGILVGFVLGVGLVVDRFKSGQTSTLSAATTNYATTSIKVGQTSFNVELATTVDQQALGLGQRDSLAANAGMLFVFKPAEAAVFWMKDMRFPLDMIWIYQGKVIAVDRNLPIPKTGTAIKDLPTYSPKTNVDYVLEVNADKAKNINIGDSFELVTSSKV